MVSIDDRQCRLGTSAIIDVGDNGAEDSGSVSAVGLRVTRRPRDRSPTAQLGRGGAVADYVYEGRDLGRLFFRQQLCQFPQRVAKVGCELIALGDLADGRAKIGMQLIRSQNIADTNALRRC